MRSLCDLTKAVPSELKSVPKEGVERCPSFRKLIDQMVIVVLRYVTLEHIRKNF